MKDKTMGWGFIAVIFLFAMFMAYEVHAEATAYWTGKSQNVTTVTGKAGVRCEYAYGNNKFWQTFVGSVCPTSVQVQ